MRRIVRISVRASLVVGLGIAGSQLQASCEPINQIGVADVEPGERYEVSIAVSYRLFGCALIETAVGDQRSFE